MRKKTILFAVQLPPPIHGSSIINDLIVNDLRIRQSFKVVVLPIQMANSLEDIGQFSFKKLTNTIKIFFQQFWILLSKKVDLFYISLSPVHFAFYKDLVLVAIAKLFRKKIVIHLHGQGIKQAALQSKAERALYRFVFRNTKVICLATPLYEDISDVYDRSPIFLANGIKEEPDLMYAPKSTTFLFLSNLMKEKGIKVFLDALLILKNKGHIFSAEIIGNSADYTIEEVRDFIASNTLSEFVKVLGPVYGIEKYTHLSKARVLVLPSFKECFPLTILEAFQAKTAVISSNSGGISEMVTHGENGFIIDPNNLEDVVFRMEHFIGNSEIASAMGELNFTKFKANYTQEIFMEKLINILHDASQ